VEVSAPGYQTRRLWLKLLDRDLTQSVVLQRGGYTLTIRTFPAGAAVTFSNSSLSYRDGMTLQPGSYQVRVSKSGYNSTTETVSIADRNVTRGISIEKGRIPLINASISSLKFFKTEKETLPRDQRQYLTSFQASSTRFIAWELNLNYPKRSQRVDFRIEHVFRDETGVSITSQSTFNAYVNTGWTSSFHTAGKGREDGTFWTSHRGRVIVDLYVNGDLVKTRSFTVQ
jgi:hypothetical protein